MGEERLSRVTIEGGSERERTAFYTALYRVFQMPTVFQDANGAWASTAGFTGPRGSVFHGSRRGTPFGPRTRCTPDCAGG